jgi:secondary thiamine-phosphate synthase enzyme
MKKYEIDLRTKQRNEMIDITHILISMLNTHNIKNARITVQSTHTTAGITVNENADPDVVYDIINFLNKNIPADFPFKHREGNSDSHLKSSFMGFSQTFFVIDGTIQLGAWQGVYFCEFDGPRNRTVNVYIEDFKEVSKIG